MSTSRKHSGLNEQVNLARERKLVVEENKRICRMERDAEVAFMQKQKRFHAGILVAKAAQIIFPVQMHQHSI